MSRKRRPRHPEDLDYAEAIATPIAKANGIRADFLNDFWADFCDVEPVEPDAEPSKEEHGWLGEAPRMEEL